MRKIGLMGGTFDPIHFGHLFIAEEARVRCELDEVIFIPTGQPAHAEGKNTHSSQENRLAMTEAAIAANPHFSSSRVEIDREGKSYAYDTICHFKGEFGEDAELFFIMGGDSINEILTWYRGAELFELCHFIAASRPDWSLDEAKGQLNEFQESRVTWMEVPGLHIASREVRKRVAQKLPIRYLVPDVVVDFVATHNLYRESL